MKRMRTAMGLALASSALVTQFCLTGCSPAVAGQASEGQGGGYDFSKVQVTDRTYECTPHVNNTTPRDGKVTCLVWNESGARISSLTVKLVRMKLGGEVYSELPVE